MLGKISWQLHRRIADAIGYFANCSLGQDASASSGVVNKALKVGLLYQLHSIRIKGAIRIAEALLQQSSTTSSSDVDVDHDFDGLESDLLCLEACCFHRADDASPVDHYDPAPLAAEITHASRIRGVIADACLALRHCRRLDAYDFKSPYRLAKTILQASKLDIYEDLIDGSVSFLSPNNALNLAFDEIWKLFDKRRPQIVAIWCVETTANRFEQLLQRTIKFEALRKKVIPM